MKNIFCGKKVIFIFGLIIGAGMMLIFTFAVPGKRSYVGRGDIVKEVKLEEPKEIDEQIVISKITDTEKPAMPDDEMSVSDIIPNAQSGQLPRAESQLMQKLNTAEDKDSADKTVQADIAKTDVSQQHEEYKFEMIPHDDIPLGPHYKMKEE